jgi:hypothetical protein
MRHPAHSACSPQAKRPGGITAGPSETLLRLS